MDVPARVLWDVFCCVEYGGDGFYVSDGFLYVVWGSICGGNVDLMDRAPIAGGQFHWVSEIAPRKYQRFISYIVGM